MAAQIYTSQATTPQIGGIAIRPVAVPDLHSGEGIAVGLHELGQAGMEFATKLKQAQDQTRSANAQAGYLTAIDEAANRWTNSPDYENAPKNFAAEAAQLKDQALTAAGLDAPQNAQLDLQLTSHAISLHGAVQGAALGRMKETSDAALNDLMLQNGNAAVNAASPTERQAAIDAMSRAVDGAKASGMIDPLAAEKAMAGFRATVDDGSALKVIGSHPEVAAELLQDPAQFPNLPAPRRQELIASAREHADAVRVDGIHNDAVFDPAKNSLRFNHAIAPDHVDAIFARGILRNEGGGPGIVSKAGALGASQILLGTARDVATALGLQEAKLSDADLRARLLAPDQSLNLKLGGAYFSSLVARYDGDVALAAAAYNAGPGRADKWKAEAVAKFGQNPTPLQVASVIGIPETQAYVLKLYGGMGVPPTGPGLSAGNWYRGFAAASEGAAGDAARQREAFNRVAAVTGDSDQYIRRLQAGEALGSDFATYYAATAQSAALGDITAIGRKRNLDDAMRAAPIVRDAYAMTAAARASELARLDQAAVQRPLVQGERDRQAALTAVEKTIGATANSDPIALLTRAGFARETPLDPGAAATDPAFLQALATRGVQAGAAAATYGGAVLPFHPAEVAALKPRFAEATPPEKLALLTSLAGAMTPAAYHAAVTQLGLDPVSEAAGRFAPERPQLTAKILAGAELLHAPGAEKADANLQKALAAAIGGDLYPPGSPALTGVIEAARAVYAANRGSTAALFDAPDQDAMQKAIEEVTGPLMTINGARVAAPPAMTADQFETVLAGLTNVDVAQFGGAVDGTGKPVDVATLHEHSILRQRVPGGSEYFVGMPDATAGDGIALYHRADGGPLVIDFAKLGVKGGAVTRSGAAPAIGPTIRDLRVVPRGVPQPYIGLPPASDLSPLQ